MAINRTSNGSQTYSALRGSSVNRPQIQVASRLGVPSGVGQDRAKTVAGAVKFIEENGERISRLLFVYDSPEGRGSPTAPNLQVLCPDLKIDIVERDRFERMPVRTSDFVIAESTSQDGADRQKTIDVLNSKPGAVFRGFFEGRISNQMVEIARPAGRQLVPKTASNGFGRV